MNDRIYLNDLGIVCALGRGATEVASRLFLGDASVMERSERYSPGRSLILGECRSPLPEVPLRAPAYQSRNNRLMALEELARVGVLKSRRPGPDRRRGGHQHLRNGGG
jgi:3-oxoacyl-[acyl-carrier-protein] synthase-1